MVLAGAFEAVEAGALPAVEAGLGAIAKEFLSVVGAERERERDKGRGWGARRGGRVAQLEPVLI